MRRESSIPPRVLPKMEGPVRTPGVQNNVCIGCGNTVNPGMCYTGTFIKGTHTREFTRHVDGAILMSGVMEVINDSIPLIVREPSYNQTNKVGFLRKEKGYICDRCASNYHTIEFNGQRVPIVQTDARPGFLGKLAIPEVERRMDELPNSSARKSSPGGNERKVLPSSQPIDKSHWLNVGRRDKKRR